MKKKANPIFPSSWKSANIEAMDIPSEVVEKAKTVEVTDGNKEIGQTGASIFFRRAGGEGKPGVDVLLLHGAAFSSDTWNDLKTIHNLAAMGHNVVAVDLPGYGNSKQAKVKGSKLEFLKEVIKTFDLDRPVVVSPSMSGGFSIPLLVGSPESLRGFVPVAPVNTQAYTAEQYKSVKTPTLIVYGELDNGIGPESTANLRNLPNSKELMIPKGKHPAYLQNPELWHKALYNFLKLVGD